VYAFSREGDLGKGLVAATGGAAVGVPAGIAAMRFLPPKYKLAGGLLGNFIGSIAGAETGIRGLNQFGTRQAYLPINTQPLKSTELMTSPVYTQLQ
jgi:hypothetical protein